jgi:hypothetical protein
VYRHYTAHLRGARQKDNRWFLPRLQLEMSAGAKKQT